MASRTVFRRWYGGNASPLSCTLVLSRNPIVTADLPDFERQYYKYQNGLWKRLMWTFPKWFYYREGTLAEQRFRELNKVPVFNNPNLEFIGGRPEIRHQRDRRFPQEIVLPKLYKEDNENEGVDNLSRPILPNSRITEADTKGDVTSLQRKLSRTLYLIVGDAKSWSFPNFKNTNRETPLHELAYDGLVKIGGDNINYFNVSKKPCHLQRTPDGKQYFIKSHILSGEFLPQDASTSYMWLTKEELADYLSPDYYNDIKHLLSDV